MSQTIIILFFACLLGLGGAMRLRHDQAKKEAARQRAEETVKAYPWDWTQGDEKKVQAALELICDKCHEPFRCSAQDELDEECSMCSVPDVVYKLVAEGRTTPPALRATSPCTGEARAVEDIATREERATNKAPLGPYKTRREEARG